MTASPDLARDLTVRRATDADRPVVLALLADSLGWDRDDTFAEFFDWKHRRNPFGASPAWVALADDAIVGFRTFLRWEFEHPDGRPRRAVRAVDTATAPAHQGRGVFRALTTTAVAEMTDEDVDFVFNTPNTQSRPGYLRMGWFDVGRLPLHANIGHASGIWRMRTARSVEYLRWRYGLTSLGYRAMAFRDDPAAGIAVFRLRRRGAAVEAGLSELLVPDGARHEAQLVRDVVRAARPDYLVRIGRRLGRSYPLPRLGPRLTYRRLADLSPVPKLRDLDFALGDVELL